MALKAALPAILVNICFCHVVNAQNPSLKLTYPKTENVPIKKVYNPQQIPLNLSTQNFGFFCRQELKLHNAHIPITFRLGTMEQCNRLEQKPGYK